MREVKLRRSLGIAMLLSVLLSTGSFAEPFKPSNKRIDEAFYHPGRLAQLPGTSVFAFRADVTGVDFPPYGLPVRLWGIAEIRGSLPPDLMAGIWQCRPVRSVADEIASGAITVLCRGGAGELSEALVRNGLATEKCPENLFGTCSQKDEE